MNEIRVLTGLHRGTSLPIDFNELQIGSGFDCDLMLADPGVSDSHLVLIQDNKLPNCWHIQVHHQDVWIRPNKRMHKNYIIKKDSYFSVGGVWLVIMDSQSEWPSGNDFIKKPYCEKNGKLSRLLTSKLAWIGMGIFIGAIALSNASNKPSEFNPQEYTVHTPEIENESQLAEYQNKDFALTNLQTVFKKMLLERGLVDVEAELEEGIINVTGSLESAQLAILDRMLVRFKQLNANAVNVINNVTQTQTSLPFKVVKVVTGRYVYVELENGIRLSPGDTYQGFKLAFIDASTITFKGPKDQVMVW